MPAGLGDLGGFIASGMGIFEKVRQGQQQIASKEALTDKAVASASAPAAASKISAHDAADLNDIDSIIKAVGDVKP